MFSTDTRTTAIAATDTTGTRTVRLHIEGVDTKGFERTLVSYSIRTEGVARLDFGIISVPASDNRGELDAAAAQVEALVGAVA